ncbi:MAG: hypothetical protein WDN06_06435 [Asticcacaulis sp.]
MSPDRPQRRRVGALVAIIAGSSSAAIGLGRHLDHPSVQPLWHRVFDIAGASLLVIAIALLIFTGITACRFRP